MRIVVEIRDASLQAFAARLEQLAAGRGRSFLAQSLNQAGKGIRHQSVPAEAAQTGLPVGTIERAQQTIEATASSLSFTILAKGGNVRLKFFGPQESGQGVVAHPWNKSTFYHRAFTMGGRPGSRVPLRFGGEVKMRAGSSRLPLKTVRSGLFIPDEMLSGRTGATLNSASDALVVPILLSRLGSLL